jgi:hypothetical protein
MTIRRVTQTNFTQGQVGPYLFGRGDTPIYGAGLETCENWLILPQGGLQKRKGFQFISADPDNTNTPDGSTPLTTTGFHAQSRLIPFKFSDGQEYVLIFEPADSGLGTTAKIHIYYNDSRIKVLTNGVDGNVFPITTSNISQIRYAQAFDYMILVHSDIRPMELIRGATNTDWTCTYIDFDHVPQANFNFDATLTPASTSGNNTNFTLAGGTYRWVNSSYPNGHVGMRLLVNGGMAEIKSISSDTVAVCEVIYDLVDTETAQGHEWEIDAFSNLSTSLGGGWPRSVTFHQNRLIFGGSRDKPQTIFGSQSADFFNFDNYTRVVDGSGNVTGEITDDAGIQFTIASDQLNIIRHLVSQQSLFVYTSDGEFDMSGEPVTPSNVLVRQQTRYGVDGNIMTPVVVDNEVLFVAKGGKQLRAFVYNFNTDAYSAKNYSLVHHDIIQDATKLAYLTNYNNTNTNYVFVVNGDGDLCVLGVNTEFSVVGWMKWNTNGNFKDLCVVDDNLYALTQRYDNDGSTLNTGVFLEKLTTEEIYLDSFHSTTATGSSFTGAQGLEGQTVNVVADGLIHPDVTVDAAGNFTLSRTSSSTQVGFNYTATGKTLPLVLNIGGTTSLGEKVRKVFAEIQLYDTKAFKVDSITVPFRNFGSTLLNQSITGYTGQKRIRLSGYTTTPQVTFTNDAPLPSTLLSITSEIKLSTGRLQEEG